MILQNIFCIYPGRFEFLLKASLHTPSCVCHNPLSPKKEDVVIEARTVS